MKDKLKHCEDWGISSVFTKNETNNQLTIKQTPLRRYWTIRYLLTLCMGLFILAIISASWIRHNTLDNRLNLMSLLADSMADRIVAVNEQTQNPTVLSYEEEI